MRGLWQDARFAVLNDTERVVWVVLDDLLLDGDEVTVDHEELAYQLGWSSEQIAQAVRGLTQQGVIENRETSLDLDFRTDRCDVSGGVSRVYMYARASYKQKGIICIREALATQKIAPERDLFTSDLRSEGEQLACRASARRTRNSSNSGRSGRSKGTPPSTKDSAAPGDSRRAPRAFVAWWRDRWRAQTGDEFVPAWGKHCAMVKPLLTALGEEEAQARAEAFFADVFWKRCGWPIEKFVQYVNRYAKRAAAASSSSADQIVERARQDKQERAKRREQEQQYGTLI